MAISAEELNIILAVKDAQLKKAMDRNNRQIKKFAGQTNKRLKSTTRSFSMVGTAAKALIPVLTAAFSFQVTQNATRFAKEVQNVANLAGTSTQEFQRMAAGAKTVGIETRKLADIYKDVNDRVGDFLETGGGPMKDFFENIAPAVGVTADQFARLSGPQALQLYVDTLERAGVSQAEMTFYLEAMASDTAALIPLLRDGGREMERLGREAQEAGRVLSNDTIESLARLDDRLIEVKDTLRTQFMEALADSSDELEVLADFVETYGVPALESLIGVASGAANAFDTAATAVSEFIRLAQVAAGIDMPTPAGGGAQYTDENGRPDHLSDSPSNGPGMLGYFDENGNWVEYGTPAASTPTPGRTAPATPTRIRSAPTPGRTGSTGGRSGGGGGGSSRDRLAGLLQEIELNEQLLGMSEARQQVMRALGADAAMYSETELGAVVQRIQAYDQERDALQMIEEQQRMIAATIEGEMSNAFMSIIDGTKTAKEAFADMARAVIAELTRVLVIQQMVGRFDAATGKGTGLVGAIMGGLSGRASGGSVMAGNAYRVGEHGPEPFVPAQNGRILSVAQAKSAMGQQGPGQTVNQTINVTTGVQQTVRAEIKSLMPQITEAAVAATRADNRRRPT